MPGGKAALSSANPSGMSSAAPTPWRARPAISQLTLGASAEPAEGGVDGESVVAMVARAPRALRHGGRAVAVEVHQPVHLIAGLPAGHLRTQGDHDAAHLVFVRAGQAISIFSLPRSICNDTGGDPRECEDANPDHPVAVFVWSDGVHCVVGSSTDRSLSVDQVRSVLEHLRPTLPAPPPR